MVRIKYRLNALSDDGTVVCTFTAKKRRIQALTCGHKTLRGSLRVTYDTGDAKYDNTAQFEDRDQLLTLLSIFSEPGLIATLER
jgi:hypothetical protein